MESPYLRIKSWASVAAFSSTMWPPRLLLVLALCAGVTFATTQCGIDPNNTFPSQGVTLKLLKHSWPTHQLVTEVAAILLSEALKYDVQIVEPDEFTPAGDPQLIAQGRFDANFELWPQGKSKELKRWVDNGPAVVTGGHYVLSHSGIYTMKYTVDKWPEAAFYQHLQTPQNSIYDSSVEGQAAADPQRLCATAEWNCSDFTWTPPKCRSNASACWGQVLHSRLGYTQGQIEQQIANNGLGLQVTYLTPEALATEVWNAFATRKHLLFYTSQPSEGFFGISDDNFVPVAFPPEGSGCNTSYTTVPTGNFSCQIPGQALLKVVSPKLQGSSDAARFAAVFSLKEADFQELLTTWRLYGDARAAACAWLQYIGQKRWGNWILFTKRIELVDSFPPTQGCFPHFYVFAGLAIVLFIVARVFSMLMHWRRERQTQKKAAKKDPKLTSDLEHLQWQMHSRACKTHVDLTSKLIGSSSKRPLVAVKWALLKGRMNFMSFFRSEEDFCQPLGQAMAPPEASSALRQYYHTKLETLVYICTSGFAKTCISALVYTCAAGAVGALLSEVRRVAELNERVDPMVKSQEQYSRFLSSMETVNLVVQGFDFLPVFLITYMIGQDVNRWHEWLQKMLQVQGRIHDLVIIVNSSYRKVNDQVNAATQRKAIFKWYRYLNAIHYLNYLNLVPSIGSAEQAMHDLETVGLLTQAECEKLRFSTVKVRDTVTSWLGRYWHEELEAGHVQQDETDVFMRKLCDLRAILAGLNDMPSKAPPQVVRMMMVIVTNTLLALALLGYPSKMYRDTNACIQFWPLLACFLYCVCYRGMLHVMFILDKGPFYAKGECVNAQENGSDEVVTCLQEFAAEDNDDDEESEVEEPPMKMLRGGPCELDPEQLMEKANEAIEHAKWERWDEMFEIFDVYPGCQNMRPEFRKYAAIHQVVFAGNVETLKRMVDSGANPGLLTRDKETPLQVAEQLGQAEVAEYLNTLEVSAEAAALLQQAHQVIDAAKEGKWDATFELLKGFKNPQQVVNTRPSVRQYGVLHQAAFHGDIEVLRRLLEDYKANVKLLTKDGKTALQIAESAGQEAAIKYLEACVPSIQLEDDFVKYPDQDLLELGKQCVIHNPRDVLRLHLLSPSGEQLKQGRKVEAAISDGDTLTFVIVSRDPRAEEWIARVQSDPNVLKCAPEYARSDPVVVMEAVKHSGSTLGYAVPELRGDKELVSMAVSRDRQRRCSDDVDSELNSLEFATPDWQRDEKMVLLAVERPYQQTGGDLRPTLSISEVYQATQTGAEYFARFDGEDQWPRATAPVALLPANPMDDSVQERRPLARVFLGVRVFPAFVKVTDADLLKRFQNLLDKTHKSFGNFTRDRNWASGAFVANTPVPSGYELVGAVRNENAALWRIYQVSKEVIRLDCTKPLKEAPFKKWAPLTMEAAKGLDWGDLNFCEDANEWLLFHASIPEALSAIARTGFTMAKLGSGGTTGGGGLYGDGTYFGDSITKADEYARRKVEHGEFKGCRAAAICRVLGGRHFYMDKDVQEKEKPKFAKRVLEGHYNSTVGDRLKFKNTFREYVAYDAASTYLESKDQ
eukprot:s1802_g6.t2